jgi:hypothetical protein
MAGLMTYFDDIYELMLPTEDDDDLMVWSDWSDDLGEFEPTNDLPLPHASLFDFYSNNSLNLLGFDDEHGGLELPSLSGSSVSTFSSDDSIESRRAMTGSFFERMQLSTRNLQESMLKSRESRKSLVFKTKRTAKFSKRVEKVVCSVEKSTTQLLQSLLNAKQDMEMAY